MNLTEKPLFLQYPRTYISPVSESAMQAAKGTRQLIVLPSFNICKQQWPACQDIHKGATVYGYGDGN